MNDREKLRQLLDDTVKAFGCELWGLVYAQQQGRKKVLRIYIEREQGITVADCERVNRQVRAVLHAESSSMKDYDLEVSSPGLDRPLFTFEQFKRFIGSKVHIRTHTLIENRRRFDGFLQTVCPENVAIKIENKAFILEWDNIARANLVPDI